MFAAWAAAGYSAISRPNRSWIVDVVVRAGVALAFNHLVLALLVAAGAMDSDTFDVPVVEPTVAFVIAAAAITPWIENAMLIGIMEGLDRWTRPTLSVLGAALILAALHFTGGWRHPVVVFPGFVVLAITYRA